MTPNRRYALGLTTGAALSTGTAAYLATTKVPLWALPAVYIAGVLAWCAKREYAFDRALLVQHEQARRAARIEVEKAGPCCPFWRHSGGAVHAPRCPRTTDPTAELNSACCTTWFVSRGDDHEPSCPTRSARSSAA